MFGGKAMYLKTCSRHTMDDLPVGNIKKTK
jgi:hypothetical protein